MYDQLVKFELQCESLKKDCHVSILVLSCPPHEKGVLTGGISSSPSAASLSKYIVHVLIFVFTFTIHLFAFCLNFLLLSL